jgi:hypothetical protein
MKFTQHRRIKGEGLGIWIIVLGIIAGTIWFIFASRAEGEKNARAFANEVVQKVVVNYDQQYLERRLNPKSRSNYSPVWQNRMFQYLRSFGPLSQPAVPKGDVYFTSQFFDPRGSFRADLNYPNQTAVLELMISKGLNQWQIDEINLIWNPPPAPSPTPSPVMTPTPTPTPTPAPQQKPRRKRGRG